ncbi:hypothetical protein RFI_05401 [Reticulomyxa filosa]|uniref:Uncharacterized protein n=1 Tax=Reticulomyxa filosa TaxID=46433 RepID=X6P2D3_RETFI|nr:hypothetical protein RFI_05401 [Reticulomyxa filosa]|eukprot:ETO31717.1 hypothetical protein RFI_05401 [Reticulomyxa filosa]
MILSVFVYLRIFVVYLFFLIISKVIHCNKIKKKKKNKQLSIEMFLQLFVFILEMERELPYLWLGCFWNCIGICLFVISWFVLSHELAPLVYTYMDMQMYTKKKKKKKKFHSILFGATWYLCNFGARVENLVLRTLMFNSCVTASNVYWAFQIYEYYPKRFDAASTDHPLRPKCYVNALPAALHSKVIYGESVVLAVAVILPFIITVAPWKRCFLRLCPGSGFVILRWTMWILAVTLLKKK